MNFEYLCKLIVVGDSGVGKSALLRRLVDNHYADSYAPTIGVDFKFKEIVAHDKTIKLQIW